MTSHSKIIIKGIIRELLTTEQSPRIPEPDLIMDTPESVKAFDDAGAPDGVNFSVYIYNAAHLCSLINSGDHVIDLGCGSANQLSVVAELNPEAQFTGIDMSDDMLTKAKEHVKKKELQNIKFKKADITNLNFLQDQSIDVIYSTVMLHHLPELKMLDKTLSEIRRVLRPGGRVFLMDFVHLKAEKTIKEFANLRKGTIPDIFIEDTYNSLRAAFYKTDWISVSNKYFDEKDHKMYITAPIPFFGILKSHAQKPLSYEQSTKLKEMIQNMPACFQSDLKDIKIFLRLGGLKFPL